MNKSTDLIKKTLGGKTLYRILFNWKVSKYLKDVDGICLDLGSGPAPSGYMKYLPAGKSINFIRVDEAASYRPDVVANLNKALPFGDVYADFVFLFNSLCYIEKPAEFFKEVHRVLKPGGNFFVTAEFIKSQETRVPDLQRFTGRNLANLLDGAGFKKIEIEQIGERFSAIANLFDFALGDAKLMRFFKIFPRLLALMMDRIWPKKMSQNYPCPICWFAVAEK